MWFCLWNWMNQYICNTFMSITWRYKTNPSKWTDAHATLWVNCINYVVCCWNWMSSDCSSIFRSDPLNYHQHHVQHFIKKCKHPGWINKCIMYALCTVCITTITSKITTITEVGHTPSILCTFKTFSSFVWSFFTLFSSFCSDFFSACVSFSCFIKASFFCLEYIFIYTGI